MKPIHDKLRKSLRRAYSAERAAAFAYIGHAHSLRDAEEKRHVNRIERDEWDHRRLVGEIMRRHDVPVSRAYEALYGVIGKLIGASCHLIGRFMPYFFAGKLESGNVCEYFVMIRYFHTLGITEHDEMLYTMGMKEKEHEVHFLKVIENERWLPWFEQVFAWGPNASLNDVDFTREPGAARATEYCKK